MDHYTNDFRMQYLLDPVIEEPLYHSMIVWMNCSSWKNINRTEWYDTIKDVPKIQKKNENGDFRLSKIR